MPWRGDGKSSGYIGYRPGQVQAGQGRARVTLSTVGAAPDWLTTSAIVVRMYVGGGDAFTSAEYAFPTAWRAPQATLPLLLHVVGGGAVAGGGAGPATTNGDAVVARRVAPDGAVELVHADGTIKRKYRGGYTIIRPGGPAMNFQFMSAQPPTPPGAPPDDLHRAWVQDESDRLLDVMRALVGQDEAAIRNYLGREPAGLSEYGRISSRTEAIHWMVTP